jgi:hypothetical protein
MIVVDANGSPASVDFLRGHLLQRSETGRVELYGRMIHYGHRSLAPQGCSRTLIARRSSIAR